MKISISNIAWSKENDDDIYLFLKENNIEGLEIAPTRIFPNNPYDCLNEASDYLEMLKKRYNLNISSIQSIWYGLSENLSNYKEREILKDYTKKAILFAEKLECRNIVFGCPKNRNLSDDVNIKDIQLFFNELGDFAYQHHTTISIEPNPVIYNTNFINYTEEAFRFAKLINNKGIKVNVDLGTILYNNEQLKILKDYKEYINHIHISEPNLELIQKRNLHYQLRNLLKEIEYTNFISIEMANKNNLNIVKETLIYIKEIFK